MEGGLRYKGNYTTQSITARDRLSISFMRATLRLTVAIRFDVLGEGNQRGYTVDL